jgi:hypothetical protein
MPCVSSSLRRHILHLIERIWPFNGQTTPNRAELSPPTLRSPLDSSKSRQKVTRTQRIFCFPGARRNRLSHEVLPTGGGWQCWGWGWGRGRCHVPRATGHWCFVLSPFSACSLFFCSQQSGSPAACGCWVEYGVRSASASRGSWGALAT